MKRPGFLWILLFCGFLGYAQEAMVLDDAIRDAVDFFTPRLQPGTTIAITNFEAETEDLSDFIIQELITAFFDTGELRVVERSRLEMLEAELDFNLRSGYVDDETAQRIGRMVGAQVLFSGSIAEYRDMYRMRVQMISVETAELIGTRTINIKYDAVLTGLLGKINPADAWKHQWFYAGLSLGYSTQILGPDPVAFGYYFAGVPFGYAFHARFQPGDLFGIALDFGGEMLTGPVISLVPTLTLRFSSFEIDVFIGAGLPIIINNTGIVILGGIRGGYKAGPGLLYAEFRPMFTTIDNSEAMAPPGAAFDPNDPKFYEGAAMRFNITLGYQLGFGQRKK
jgi:TolB-like protein